MEDLQEDLNIYSEEVRDVLSHPPKSIFIWGNTILFGFLLVVLLLSWLIKYPEFVPASVTITSKNPPEKLEARTNSKIEKILVNANQNVEKGQLMMVLQSTANYKDILELRKIIDSLPFNDLQAFPLSKTSVFKLGEIQGEYNNFAKALQDEKLFIKLQPYAPENMDAEQNIWEYKNRIANLQQQKNLEIAKFDLTKKNFRRSQELYEQGVIPAMELENEKIKYLQAEQNLKNINITLSQMQEAISGLKKTKSNVSINTEKDRINFSSQTQQLYEQLSKSLRQWEQNYLLISSINGTVSFQQFWGENQFVKAGDVLMSVLPENKESIIGRMQISAINSGKVRTGQKVLIKLDNYRYQEYGIIEGKVHNISLTTDSQDNYFVDVILPNGLKTSYNQTFIFDKELRGTAEIVTEDLRLLERVFYQFRKLLGYQV